MKTYPSNPAADEIFPSDLSESLPMDSMNVRIQGTWGITNCTSARREMMI